jgi:hypothetical protein
MVPCQGNGCCGEVPSLAKVTVSSSSTPRANGAKILFSVLAIALALSMYRTETSRKLAQKRAKSDARSPANITTFPLINKRLNANPQSAPIPEPSSGTRKIWWFEPCWTLWRSLVTLVPKQLAPLPIHDPQTPKGSNDNIPSPKMERCVRVYPVYPQRAECLLLRFLYIDL